MNRNGSKPRNKPGEKIGRLTLIERVGSDKNRYAMWKCQCECGNIITLAGTRIGRNVSSCGCLRHDATHLKKWKGVGEIPMSYWGGVIRNATKRNIEVQITIQDAWDLFVEQNKLCALTNQPLSFTSDKKNSYYGTASLDRIDNTQGYVKGNVCWLHKDVNIMKKDHSVQEFINICRLVTEHNDVDTKQVVK